MILPRTFYSRPTVSVARDLLAQNHTHETPEGKASGLIVEVEAYLPKRDPGCHAARGLTPRNQPMFGPPGRAYVYFCYGNHYLFNIVTEKEGVPGAVLIRSLEPVEGQGLMAKRRGGFPPTGKNLTNGPGKLAQALKISRSHNGMDLCQRPLYVRRAKRRGKIGVTTRIGLTEGSELPLRFYLEGTDYLSVKPGLDRPSPGMKKKQSQPPSPTTPQRH